jgi:hypothetical protein
MSENIHEMEKRKGGRWRKDLGTRYNLQNHASRTLLLLTKFYLLMVHSAMN